MFRVWAPQRGQRVPWPCGRGHQIPRAPDRLWLFPQLSEWWLKTAYLQYRQPVVICSNPGLMLPKQDFVDLQGQLR